MNFEEKARSLFLEGYNCAQAVFCAFCPETGLDESLAKRLASSFGGGLGRMREVCGAVSGMAMVAGILYGYDDPKDREIKREHYQRIQTMAKDFRNEFGSILCREILESTRKVSTDPMPDERNSAYYQKRKCLDCVGKAAAITAEWIERDGKL